MAICSCVDISQAKWNWDSPTGCNPSGDAGAKALCVVDNILIKSGDYAGKTLKVTLDAILTSKDKINACKLWNTLKNISDKSSWVKSSGDKLGKVRGYRNNLCKVIGVKCNCAAKLDSNNTSCYDEALANEKAAGCADSDKEWSDSKCKCVKGGSKKPQIKAEPEKVYGCLDRTASTWYCIKNECIGVGKDRKPPEHVIGIPCEYVKEYEITNKYVFCNRTSGCFKDTEDKVTPTLNKVTVEDTGTLAGLPGGVLGQIGNIYDAQKAIIKTANLRSGFLYLVDDGQPQGFYIDGTWSDTLVNEFAAALTIEIFKTKMDGADTFPFQSVTVFSPDSKLIGHFSIVPNSDENGEATSISKLVGKEGSKLLNYRLANHVGTKITKIDNLEVYRKQMDKPGGMMDNKYSLDKNGMVIKDPVTEGLASVLKEKPIGLAKLLK